jgi:hypothetical protein
VGISPGAKKKLQVKRLKAYASENIWKIEVMWIGGCGRFGEGDLIKERDEFVAAWVLCKFSTTHFPWIKHEGPSSVAVTDFYPKVTARGHVVYIQICWINPLKQSPPKLPSAGRLWSELAAQHCVGCLVAAGSRKASPCFEAVWLLVWLI